MSLPDLQAQLMWDAASKGGSPDQVNRRYNEALQYLMGLAQNNINSSRGAGVNLANMVGTQPNPYLGRSNPRPQISSFLRPRTGSLRGGVDY